MVFLAGVLLAAVVGGLGPSIAAAVASLFVYDFFFVEPHFTFTVTKPQDILSLVTFLVVAVLTSQLMARVRAQASAARHREARTAALYAFTREIGGANRLEELAHTVVQHVAKVMRSEVALSLAESGRLVVRAVEPPARRSPTGSRQPPRGCSSTASRPATGRARSPGTSICTSP
jgi:two-component system sensor histidine kinase KdpD